MIKSDFSQPPDSFYEKFDIPVENRVVPYLPDENMSQWIRQTPRWIQDIKSLDFDKAIHFIEYDIPQVVQDIKSLDKWIDDGGKGVFPPLPSRGPNGSDVFPGYYWDGYPDFFKRAVRTYDRRQNMIALMDAELKRRKQGKKRIEVPYDDKRKFVITEDYGCLESNK
jgi:hypothetical protein